MPALWTVFSKPQSTRSSKIQNSFHLRFILPIFLGSVSHPVFPSEDYFPILTKVTFKASVEIFECVLGLGCQSIFLKSQIIPFSFSCTISRAQNKLHFEVRIFELTLIFNMGLRFWELRTNSFVRGISNHWQYCFLKKAANSIFRCDWFIKFWTSCRVYVLYLNINILGWQKWNLGNTSWIT